MSDFRQYISLDSIVNDYIDETQQSINQYYRLWNLAFRGMEQLGLDFFYQLRTVRLTVASNKTVVIPNDYISYTKVGVLNSIGEIITLTYNNNMTTYADTLSNRDALTQDDTLGNYLNVQTPIWYNYYNNGLYANAYGVPSGSPFVGTFKVDNDNGVILLGENFGYDYIMLEYLASPKENQNFPVPMQFREALIAWLAWKDIANIPSNRRGNLGDKRDRRHEFYNERRLALSRWKPYRSDDAYHLALEMQRMAVKS